VKISNKSLSVLFTACFITAVLTEDANARFLIHATRKAFAPKIAKAGFKTARMDPTARFGRKIYFADKAKTAIKEKPSADALMRFRKSRLFEKRILDTTQFSTSRLRRISGLKDMRGTVKNSVIGPKLGHKIGDYGGKNQLIVKYRSARYKAGKDYALSPSLYGQHSRIVRPVRSTEVW
jgi:hypothetical protein